MKLKLLRSTEAEISTEGKLFINDTIECYTLEDKDRHLEDGGEKVYGETAIPRGTYPISITHSQRFQKRLIYIHDVPQFTGVRIHPGNSAKDSSGCILVGSVNKQDDDNFIGGSRIAYNRLHEKVKSALDDGEEVTLEVV